MMGPDGPDTIVLYKDADDPALRGDWFKYILRDHPGYDGMVESVKDHKKIKVTLTKQSVWGANYVACLSIIRGRQ